MFVSCVRACEAVRVREAGVPNAGGSDGEICGDSGAGLAFHFLMLYAWVLKKFIDIGNPCVGFKANSLILTTLAWVLRKNH